VCYAPCKHFTYCGGCHYQHINYPTQEEIKSAILCEQLERIGGLQDITEVEVISAPDAWCYRNHIQFHLTQEGRLGFQQARSNHTFPIHECHLPDRLINQVWPLLDIEPVRGLERVSLRAGVNEDLMLILESTNPEPLDFQIEDLAISVVYRGPESDVVLAGGDTILVEVSGEIFQVSAGSFFQVNTSQAEAMVGRIMEYLPLSDILTVMDVYCGVGLFSAFLAPHAKSLIGIEVSPEACTDFTTNLDAFDIVSLYEAPAEEVLAHLKFKPDAIIVDPPRDGLGVKTVEGILAQEATILIYVSCDPATLARDARNLTAGGYTLDKVALIDMFPQTYHIESITRWVKS
jgi:23S rRNA (uracil1939-C5)-methyltransferase